MVAVVGLPQTGCRCRQSTNWRLAEPIGTREALVGGCLRVRQRCRRQTSKFTQTRHVEGRGDVNAEGQNVAVENSGVCRRWSLNCITQPPEVASFSAMECNVPRCKQQPRNLALRCRYVAGNANSNAYVVMAVNKPQSGPFKKCCALTGFSGVVPGRQAGVIAARHSVGYSIAGGVVGRRGANARQRGGVYL